MSARSFPARRFSRRLAGLLLAGGLLLLAQGLYIPAKAALAQVLLTRAWAATLAGTPTKPWPLADVAPVAELTAPDLGLREIVLGGTSGEAMAFGPGHMSNTPKPGAPGTSVIAGHRDTHLAFLKRLRVGDTLRVTGADGRPALFRVSATRVARWDASGLSAADGGPTGARLALVTCYPFEAVGHGPLRYIVLAERVAL